MTQKITNKKRSGSSHHYKAGIDRAISTACKGYVLLRNVIHDKRVIAFSPFAAAADAVNQHLNTRDELSSSHNLTAATPASPSSMARAKDAFRAEMDIAWETCAFFL
jgi:hypothetical protein